MMTNLTPKNGRPPDARDEVVSRLRRDIISGKLAPGTCLPTHQKLKADFRVASTSVLGAMRILQEDGFIVTEHRRGTFVATHPPHLCHYALVFPHSEIQMEESQFYTAIRNEAAGMEAPDCRFSCFFGISDRVEMREYERLMSHIQARRLAGVIFAFNPFILPSHLALMKDLKQSQIPSVAIAQPETRVSCPTVYPDLDAFRLKALQHLTARKRRRIAHLLFAPHTGSSLNCIPPELVSSIQSFGLDPTRPWIQGVPAPSAGWARQVVRILFDAGPSRRPNALIIYDDNLVPAATQGLLDVGLKVPQDVEVVALVNFPWPTPSAVPVKRLGFNITELILVCRERIAQQRNGIVCPSTTLLPACFSSDTTAHTTVALRKKDDHR